MSANHKLCPICKKQTVEKYQPFCSERCLQIDMGRWLKGVYAIETDQQPETNTVCDIDED